MEIPRSTREMRARRKRPQFFKVHAGDAVYYTGGMFYVSVRLAIDSSLAKISEANLRLAASPSDYYTMIRTCILYCWLGKNIPATPRLVIEDQELWKMSICEEQLAL